MLILLAHNSLKASKLTFVNVFMRKKVKVEQLRKPQSYRVDFLKVLVTLWKIQNLKITTWNFPKKNSKNLRCNS